MNFCTTLRTTSGGRPLKWIDGVEAVAEFRREQALDRLFVLVVLLAAAEADALLGRVRRAGIGGHDQDDVPEIDLLAVRIGERAVVHHLQQDVEQVRVRLLDFVEQQHASADADRRRRSAGRPDRSRHSPEARR